MRGAFPRTFTFNYLIDPKTVVRAGYGISYPPSDLFGGVAPTSSLINSAITGMVTSVDGGVTPFNTLRSPFPADGTPGNVAQAIHQPAGRSQAYLASMAKRGLLLVKPDPVAPESDCMFS